MVALRVSHFSWYVMAENCPGPLDIAGIEQFLCSVVHQWSFYTSSAVAFSGVSLAHIPFAYCTCLLKRLHIRFISLSRSRSRKPCILRYSHWSSWSCHMQAAISVRVLFHHGLAIGLELYFFATCSLVHIIAVVRADTAFSRLVMEIGLLVSISTFRGSQRCSRISTKAVDHTFLLVLQTSFSLYLHNQWTDFHKLSCTGKPQMRAIRTYMGCTKATTND